MAAERVARSRDGERMLKSATAHKMRRAEAKQAALSVAQIQLLMLPLTLLVMLSCAADATSVNKSRRCNRASECYRKGNKQDDDGQKAYMTCR
jgi:hypothetical protein